MVFDPTLGATVVLPPTSQASRAARGAAASTIEANTALRDIDLARQGYNLASPSGNYTAAPTPTLLALVPVGAQNGNTNSSNDTTNNSLNSRMSCWAPANSDITNIQLIYPTFATIPTEADWPVSPYTVTAAIEYPAGTFYPVFTAAGSRTLTVNAGRSTLGNFAACPVVIPAGAQFWVKSYVQWATGNFWMTTHKATYHIGEWTRRAVGATDLTLDVTAQATTTNLYGFGPNVFGSMITTASVLGVIGDSISVSDGYPRPGNIGGSTWIGEAMRGALPVLNLGAGGDTMTAYLNRSDGRMSLMRDRITHLMFLLCRNDVASADTLATLQSNLQRCLAPWLADGVKVWAATCIPTSTSSDGWATVANQTAAATEAKRQQYNAWLMTNWASLGLQGVMDWAHAVDPGDIGKWSADGTVYNGARGFATVTNGVITACAQGGYNGDSSGATNGYPANQTGIPLAVTNMPGDPGRDAVITGNTNASGLMNTYTVANGGYGYLYQPMITIPGRWTNDGVHPNRRAVDQMIRLTALRPEMFV